MFAGLPGIGVGTLFYVLTALWMPLRECPRLLSGQSSWRRWRVIGVQCFFALSIVASVALAERAILWVLGDAAPGSVGPARLVSDGLAARSVGSILAAPVAASLLLLGAVLALVELLRILKAPARRRPARAARGVDALRDVGPAPDVHPALRVLEQTPDARSW